MPGLTNILRYSQVLDPSLAREDVKKVGLFPRGYVSVVAGEPGVGKTWLMLDICRSIAENIPGPGDPVNPYPLGKSLLFAGETGVRMLIDRMSLLGGITELSRCRVVSSHEMSRLDIDVMLNTSIGRKNIEGAVAQYRPDLVFFDTVISFMGAGKDESSQVDMTDSIRGLSMIASQYDTAIVLLHHFRKRSKAELSERVRGLDEVIGTSAFTRLASLVVGIERKAGSRFVHCIKSWWEEFNPFSFSIVKGDDGKIRLDKTYSYLEDGAFNAVVGANSVVEWICKNMAGVPSFSALDVTAGCGFSRTLVSTGLRQALQQKKIYALGKNGHTMMYTLTSSTEKDTGDKVLELIS